MLSLNLTHLIDDAKCYETVRQMRWTHAGQQSRTSLD